MLAGSLAMTSIPAEDIQRAAQFYSEVLGLIAVDTPSEGSAIFEAGGGSQIFIYQRDRSTAQHTAINFIVEDIDTTVEGLIERGVTFEHYDFDEFSTDDRGIAEMGEAKMAWLTDTEGNILALLSQ